MKSRASKSTDELGAHVSAAGGVYHAPGRAETLGSVVFQLFTKQPSRWAEPVLTDEHIRSFRAAFQTSGIAAAAAHDSYLINLASPDVVLRARSLDSFRRELERCRLLGVPFVVTHPGNATNGDVPSAIVRNAEAVQQALEDVADVNVLFETTAGAGSVLGASFEQLAAILDRIPQAQQSRLGVCLDTCHVWAAGYDLRNAYDDVMARFDDVIGCRRIRLFHLNDSLGGLGSRRDRHADIGKGALGDEPFRRLLHDDRFRATPKLLETPKGDDALRSDRRNLRRLRRYR